MSISLKSKARGRRRGITIVYAAAAMGVIAGFASLAVEYGRVREIKLELSRCADATALAALNVYAETGDQTAAYMAALTSISQNPVDPGSGFTPTVTIAGGTWNAATKTFSAAYAPGTPAGLITLSRTAANNNAVPLNFGRLIGMNSVNVSATAIATLIDNASTAVSVPATSNPYLAGAPSGVSTAWGDNTTNATPTQITGIPVVPGTWITLTAPAGTSCIVPGTTGSFGAEGEASRLLHHGENYDHTVYNIGPENGIGDAVMPACAVYGVFLTDADPSTRTPPPLADWSAPGRADQPSYNDIQLQQPFLIGDGVTTGGVVQRFQVPPGATRLYMGVWDGVTQSNNSGTITATMNLKRSVRLVK